MSVHISSRCWKIDLPPTQKLVLVSLADQASDEGVCWPSIAGLMRRTGLSARGVQTSIRQLEAAGLLKCTSRAGHSNSYQLPVTTPAPRAPRRTCTPAPDAPPPPHHVHPTPAGGAPRTVIEPSVEPSGERVRAKRFTPPSLLEVRQFIGEHGYAVDPVKWWNHYAANGWRVGRNPMKDWKAAVRTWTRSEVT